MNTLAMPMKTSLVTVSSKIGSEPVSQEYPVNHPDGAQSKEILAAAFNLFQRIGGIVMETESEWWFCPIHMLTEPVKFEVRSVILADASALKSGPQFLQ